MWSAPRLYHASDSSILVQFQELTDSDSGSSERDIFQYSGSSERVVQVREFQIRRRFYV
jgi:hypothetical protein